MALTDSSISLSEEVECIDLSKVASDEEVTSFGIEYDDDAILAFNPTLRDEIGRYPVANYAPSEYDLQHIEDSPETGAIQSARDEVSNLVLSNGEDFSSENEHNDEIQNINPDLTNDTERNSEANHSQERESQARNESIMASGDMSFGRGHEIQRLAAEIVSEIRSKIPRLDKFKQELSQMREDVKSLKDEYSVLDSNCRKTSIVQNRTVNTAKAYINNLDLVIYQNRVINHLDDAVKQMKLFECHVTADRKIIFVDTESPGTDIDTPVHISTSRAFNLVDREFKRGFAVGGPEDISDVF